MANKDDRIDRYRQHVPQRYLALYNEVTSGSKSKNKAIKLQCIQCYGYEFNSSATCDNLACPLYNVNPYRVRRVKKSSMA